MSVAGSAQDRGLASPKAALATMLEGRLAPLAASVLEIRDDSAQHIGHAGAAGGAGHFSLTIVSEHFLGMTRLARHRAVLECVGDLIPYPVHALAIQAFAPNEPRSNERN